MFFSAIFLKGEISIWYQKCFLAEPQKRLSLVYVVCNPTIKKFLVFSLNNKKAAYLEFLFTFLH